MYLFSFIKVLEKWVSVGEIDLGLDNICFIIVGDILVDFIFFVLFVMFCFFWICFSNCVFVIFVKGEGWESLVCVVGGSVNNW